MGFGFDLHAQQKSLARMSGQLCPGGPLLHDLHKLHMHPELKTVAPAIHCKKTKAGKGLELHDHPEKRCCDRHRPGRPGCSIFYFAKATNSSIRSKTASPGQ